MKWKLTNNKKIWLPIIVGLVILNILRWWPEGDDLMRQSKKAEVGAEVAELVVAIPEDSMQHEKGIVRDLFQMQLPKRKEPPKQVKSDKKPQKILPSAEQLMQQKARAGLASIKLIATAQRKGKLRAYLSKGESSLVVTEGMEFAQDYTVIRITVNSIAISHNNTGIQREIMLSE